MMCLQGFTSGANDFGFFIGDDKTTDPLVKVMSPSFLHHFY